MALFKWKEKFVDIRECAVEAETLEEAKNKSNEGDWAYEHTVDFYSEEIITPISGPYKD